MKSVISFSGGKTSAYLVYLMGVLGEVDEIVFCDTGAEHPETYNFIRELNVRWGVEITCLRGDFSTPLNTGNIPVKVSYCEINSDLKPFSWEMQKYGVPYMGGGMHCSTRMKGRIFKAYCKEKYGLGNFQTWLGIRADEPSRLVGDKAYSVMVNHMGLNAIDVYEIFMDYQSDVFSSAKHFVDGDHHEQEAWKAMHRKLYQNRCQNIRMLAEVSEFDKQDVIDWWAKEDFNLNIEEHLGNCVFCPKKSDLKLVLASRECPELYKQWLNAIKADEVRVDDRTGSYYEMYRKKRSIEQLLNQYSDVSTKDIKSRMRGTRMNDSGSCSESCEAVK